jgi:hypothetical protein
MSAIRSLKPVLNAIAISLTMVGAMSSASAASGSSRKPVVLDSQSGINDGQSGTILQTAPLSQQPIVEARPIATPTELAPNSSVPLVVAPDIQLPIGGGATPQPRPRPVPRPQ